MTPENQRRNAQAEIDRATACLSEARTLQAASLPYGAASRAYYAVFHAARALLFSLGMEVKTHAGVVSLIGEHFVRPGRLSAEQGRLISRMQRDREDADYASGAIFTLEEVARMIADAEAFLSDTRRIIGA